MMNHGRQDNALAKRYIPEETIGGPPWRRQRHPEGGKLWGREALQWEATAAKDPRMMKGVRVLRQ
jgi:hypothetical protein